jgi:fructose-1,6-bisphosphatase II / sedoheptulose-1,7-bisphosphatase
VIATSRPGSGIDIYMGSGGSPEGVLAAAALRCIGGQFQGRLLFRNDEERERARRLGIDDLERVYHIDDLAKGDVTFTATGVTDGTMLKGVRRVGDRLYTESIVMRSKSGTVRLIEAEHNLHRKSAVVPHFSH